MYGLNEIRKMNDREHARAERDAQEKAKPTPKGVAFVNSLSKAAPSQR